MQKSFSIISPVDGHEYASRPYVEEIHIAQALQSAEKAQLSWREYTLNDRIKILTECVEQFQKHKDALATELTWLMGRPVSQTPGEIRGFIERATYMLSIAESSLATFDPGPKEGFMRAIYREPLGVILVIAPWNYPYLTAVNTIIPALAAGNAVLLKHSPQTALCAEQLAQIFLDAGLPSGLLQSLHLTHEHTEKLIQHPAIQFVAFTGSVAAGHRVVHAAKDRFINLGLELGGKDPAYVCRDANLVHAVENLVDGAFFNSGQSCCGIERIYVAEEIYPEFVERFVDLTKGYKLGNPIHLDTNLGPVVSTVAAEKIRDQIIEACRMGAKACIDASKFAAESLGNNYLSPQVLTNVTHQMRVMREETFGPVVGIMPVSNEAEAISLMNDSPYGLTASIWTQDLSTTQRIGKQLATGTVFMNRCDYLDPALAWTGVKDTGRGISLSRLGYEQLTRVKSYHLKVKI